MIKIAKGLLILALFVGNIGFASEYHVLVLPDNVSNKPTLDAMVYEGSAEFFANQVINKLNLSNTIKSPTVSEVRELLKKNTSLNISTRENMQRFKKEYNVNYLNVQRLAKAFNVDKVLLITTSADAQNYFMRRTFWDFLNIPGAAVTDPAIKLSTYAVLVDTKRNVNIWEDTFYKTVSCNENRMVANSLGPQTIQLEKIRDYSQLLGPQIASNVQANLVTQNELNRDNEITYGAKDIDNVFTKKFKSYKHNVGDIANDTSNKYDIHNETQRAKGVEPLADKFKRWKLEHKQRMEAYKIKREQEKQEKIRLKKEEAILKQEKLKLEQEKIRLEQEKLKQKNVESSKIQEINNKKMTKPLQIDGVKMEPIKIQVEPVQKSPIIPAVEVKQKQEEPKILNITKEDVLEPAEIQEVQKPALKYYQPKERVKIELKNTTINDI